MRGSLLPVIAVLLIALSLPVGSAARPSPAPGRGDGPAWATRVEGRVTDAATGQPVPGALVSLPGLDANGRAGPDGAFGMAPIPLPGPVYTATVTVTAPGYGRWSLAGVRLYAGDALRLRVRLGAEPVVRRVALPRPLTAAGQLPGPAEPDIRSPAGSDVYPPATIRVGITGQTGCVNPPPIQRVEVVDFQFYVEHVLPSEWIGGWPAESLRAGAMAVKTYAWYWVNRGGKWAQYGADVLDSTCDQVYDPDYSYWKTDLAVADTWASRMIRDGAVFPAYYYAGTYDGAPTDGRHMTQWGSKYWADQGQTWDWILRFYYTGIEVLDIPPPFRVLLPAVSGGTEQTP